MLRSASKSPREDSERGGYWYSITHALEGMEARNETNMMDGGGLWLNTVEEEDRALA
jgi:hypothetical protein